MPQIMKPPLSSADAIHQSIDMIFANVVSSFEIS